MPEYSILVNYQYCTGCQSCMLACKNENGFDEQPYGVNVLENGPYDLGDKKWEWDYIPMFTDRCNYCVERKQKGEKAACELHCLAQCLTVAPYEELVGEFESIPSKAYLVRK